MESDLFGLRTLAAVSRDSKEPCGEISSNQPRNWAKCLGQSSSPTCKSREWAARMQRSKWVFFLTSTAISLKLFAVRYEHLLCSPGAFGHARVDGYILTNNVQSVTHATRRFACTLSLISDMAQLREDVRGTFWPYNSRMPLKFSSSVWCFPQERYFHLHLNGERILLRCQLGQRRRQSSQ